MATFFEDRGEVCFFTQNKMGISVSKTTSEFQLFWCVQTFGLWEWLKSSIWRLTFLYIVKTSEWCFQMKYFYLTLGIYKTKLSKPPQAYTLLISARKGLTQLHLYFAMFGWKFQLEIDLRLIALIFLHRVIVIQVLKVKQNLKMAFI